MARQLIGRTRAGQALAIAACCVVLAVGCTPTVTPPVPATGGGGSESVQPTGSVTQPQTNADGAGGGGAGGAGNGGGDGGNQAAGSPIDVPTIPEKHVSMEGLRDAIRDLFVTACGGHDLCVKLEYGDGPCFVGYEPAALAARGSTVRVLTESQEDCDRANGLDGTTQGSSPPTDVPSSGTSAPQTDVPSSGTTGSGTTGSGTTGGSPGNGQSDGSSR